MGGVWIRQPLELYMKRLLGLLLVMVGMSPHLSLMQAPPRFNSGGVAAHANQVTHQCLPSAHPENGA